MKLTKVIIHSDLFIAMFPRDKEELSTLKDNYYFFINQCYKEIRRSNRLEMFATNSQYIKFSSRMKEKLYEDLQIWTDFEMRYKEENFPFSKDDIYYLAQAAD
jgi:hypothetical protein